LSACGDKEMLHTQGYYQVLGSEKTTQEIDRCITAKQQLTAQSDAMGADRFAKSNRSMNCLNAALVEASHDATIIVTRAAVIKKAKTRDALKAAKENALAILNQWDQRIAVFPEWKSQIVDVFMPAVTQANLNYTNQSMLIEIGAIGPRK
jgi:hypothetical protein